MRDWEQGVVAERYIVPSGAALPRELRKEAITQEKRAEQERQTERAVDAWLEG
jgi:hypothetical protein